MSGRPWYKRYGADFVHGCLGLTLEEKGAYSLCLDLIYDRGGPIPDDARWLAGVCGVSLRKWSALRARLLEAGKLVERKGRLSNVRAEKEIETAAKAAQKLAESGAKGGEKRAENARSSNSNNDVEQASLKHTRINQKPEARDQIPEEEQFPSLPSEAPPPLPISGPDDVALAVEAYNATAAEAGWSKVQRITPHRQASLKARLRECGGIDGWRGAMARARASPFLCGDNDRGWTAGFDFLLQAKSFTKLMEGAYDRSDRPSAGPREPSRGPTQSERGRAAMAEILAGRPGSRLSAAPTRPPGPVGPAAGGGIGDVLPFGDPPGARFVR